MGFVSEYVVVVKTCFVYSDVSGKTPNYRLWSTVTDTGVRHGHETRQNPKKIGYKDTTRYILLLLYINKFIKS